MTAYEINNSIIELDNGVFINNTNISRIILPDSLKKIGERAFYGCAKLKDLQLGKNIDTIGAYAFEGTAYFYDEVNTYNGIVYVDNYAIGLNPNNLAPSEITFKNGTVLIADYLFADSDVEKVFIPNSVKYIGKGAFRCCKDLKIVGWSSGLEKIGEDAFYSCINLKSINVGEGVLIERSAFSNVGAEYVRIENPNAKLVFSSRSKQIETLVGYSVFAIEKAKQIVLPNEEMVKDFKYLVSGKKIYTNIDKEYEEFDSYTLNNNNVFFSDEWYLISFFVDNTLVSMRPYDVSEIIKVPAQNYVNDYLPSGAIFTGWDINGDGIVDELPVTLTSDIEAVAVYDAPIVSISMLNEVSLEKGEATKLAVNYEPVLYNHDDSISWISNDESIASVNENGVITGVSEGNTTITARLLSDDKIYTECTVNVSARQNGIKLPDNNGIINVGETLTLEPEIIVPDGYEADLVFSSDNELVATVDDNGMIKAITAGVANITISYGNDYSAEFTVTVKQPMTGITLSETEGTVNVGETITLSPVFEPANTTDDKTVFWYSKNTSVAKVNSSGVITGIAPGTAEIVGVVGSFKVTYTITVKAPIERITLNTSKGTLRLDHTKQLDVIFIPSNTTDDRSVVWSSADPEIASVDENGLVTGIKNGKTVITGTVGSGTENEHSATYTVSVIGLRDEATGITVTNSDDTEMEDGTSLVVDELNEDEADEIYNEYGNSGSLYGGIKLLIKDKHGRVYFLYIYDISLFINNTCIQPGTEVDVDIPFPKGLIKNNSHVYRVEIDGGLTELDVEVHSGFFRFKTDHFSVYALAVPTDTYEAADIELDTDELTLCIGEMHTVGATVLPEEAEDKSLTYTSADENVATVDVDGNITGISEGTTTITVSSVVEDVEKTIEVTVTSHKYSEPTWTWDGTEKAEAKFVCENDKEHIKTIEAVITDEVITAPTCETEGETKYTATVTFEGNVYVDVKNEKTTATGHKFGKPEWTWDGVNGATAKFTCSNDESHSQTLVAAITDETIVAATYDSEGEKKYTASVEFEGVTYTDEKLESIAALVYDYDAPEWIWDETKSAKAKFVRDDGFTTVIDAEIVSEITTDETCEAYGEKTYTATVTFEGKTYTDEKAERIDPLGHKYGKPVWTWNGTETAEAKFICENDSEHTEVLQAIITDEVTVEPAYDTKGERTYTATVTFNGETYTSIKTEEIEALTKPEIVSDPSDLRTIRGSKGRFTVKATGDNLTYQWQVSKDGKTWVNSSSEGSTADTIAIIATKSLNGRMYRCMVTDGISVLYSKPATFTTIEVVSLNPKNTTATEGNTVKLTIKSRSSVAKLQWQVSKDGGKTWVNSGSDGNKTTTLSFAVKISYNGWKYRCKVTNGTWVEYSSAALLTVNPKVNIITQPKNVSTYYGNIAKFTVKAEGDNLKYQWQVSKDGTKWTNSSAAGNKTETLRFTATSTLNGRYFRCKVTGGGKTVYTVAVKLTSKKNIITQPKAVSVKAGAKASFTIKAGGNSLKYQWQVSKDGGKTWTNSKSAGYNTAALSITAKAGYSGWMFRCIVTNGTVKTVSNAAKLTVK